MLEHKSRAKAIRLKCLDCCGGQAREVFLCTATKCPLWPFRTGRSPHSPNALSANQAAKSEGQIEGEPYTGCFG